MTYFSRIALSAWLFSVPALAQTPKSAAELTGNSTSYGNLSINPNGVRLDATAKGPARVTSPQLDVSARAIALDKKAGGAVTQVRALNSVTFKLNLPASNGEGAARIEATCDNAVLTPKPLKLVLKGNLKGFYQLAGGAKNTLGGDEATFTKPGGNLLAELTGGVTLVVPAETLGQSGEIGDVTVTAQRAQIDQSDGTATFAGNARAVSKGGANAFDVTAPRFTLTRQADGTFSSIKTLGRTLVKLDLPPDPTPADSPAPTGTNTSLGQPTHVEVAADGAVIEPRTAKRATSVATFEGNVKGFYRLTPPQGTASGTPTAPQNYNFVGTKAVIRYLPTPNGQNALAGFNLDLSDADIKGPPFDFGF